MNIKEVFKGLSFWRKALVSACAVFIVVIVLLLVNHWYVKRQIEKGDLVEWGGRLYTKEELNKAFPPQYYEAVAKNTPEEVYMTFRQALLDGNIDLALEQISSKRKEVYRTIFKDENIMMEWGRKLPQSIAKEDEMGNYAHYNASMNTGNKNGITFTKDINGYWKIDSI